MIVLIVTSEKSGVDRYSQEIARRLDVKTVESRRYLSLLETYRLSRVIQEQQDIVHLPGQEFARYALFRKNPFIVTVHDLTRFCFGFDKETCAYVIECPVSMNGFVFSFMEVVELVLHI